MSAQVRRKIMYWFTLILGILILSRQCYCYYNSTITLSVGEFAVTLIAVVLMVNPHSISDSYSRIIKSKFNDTKDEQ